MPQVFSAGWLYLFIIIMVISLVRIWLKMRTLNQGPEMDRPVIRVSPVAGTLLTWGGRRKARGSFPAPTASLRRGSSPRPPKNWNPCSRTFPLWRTGNSEARSFTGSAPVDGGRPHLATESGKGSKPVRPSANR